MNSKLSQAKEVTPNVVKKQITQSEWASAATSGLEGVGLYFRPNVPPRFFCILNKKNYEQQVGRSKEILT